VMALIRCFCMCSRGRSQQQQCVDLRFGVALGAAGVAQRPHVTLQ
jgi:hypothetical protein